MVQNWTVALNNALTSFLERVALVLPSLVGAGLVLVLGSMLAMGLGEIAGTIVEKLKIDQALEKTVLQPVKKNMGIQINVSKTFEELVKWFILIVVFIAAADIARLHQVIDFLNQVLLYLPNIFVAILILLVASLLASFVGNMISTIVKDDLFSTLARVAIFTFATMAALHQLQISQQLIEILFTGIVATCVLAFGIGGKDVAGDITKRAYDDLRKRSKR